MHLLYYCKAKQSDDSEVFYTGATQSGDSMGGCNFDVILTFIVPKCHRKKGYIFDEKHS